MSLSAGSVAVSPPASSPRLPSPPPLSEDFIHPKSPIALSEDRGKLENANKVDHGASRRIRPGTRAVDMADGPPVVELTDLDSAFQLTEHLKALHHAAMNPPDSTTTMPISSTAARNLAQPPDGVDRTAWLYELCRFLCQKLNSVLIALFADTPPCSAATCPEMRASEWQYLCAVHDPPKSCCAIDYCCHTLDWAATTLTSPRNFPSRLALSGGKTGEGAAHDGNAHQQQARQLTNVFRRVYRIFAHAWFQHREMFWKVEGRTGLYVLFKTVCDAYQLIPEDNYTIPPEAEGTEPKRGADEEPRSQPSLLKRLTAERLDAQEPLRLDEQAGTQGLSPNTAGATTKRHKHSPSAGATPIHTSIEEIDEDDDPGLRRGLSRQDTLRDERATGSRAQQETEAVAELGPVDADTKAEPLVEDEQGEDVTALLEEDATIVLDDLEAPTVSGQHGEPGGAAQNENAEVVRAAGDGTADALSETIKSSLDGEGVDDAKEKD